jgi:hypothetical protein
MNRIDNATIAHNMKWGMILIGALILALFLGTTLATDSQKGLMSFAAILFPLAWIMAGTKYWWYPIPFAVTMGGLFQFSFKIFPHELAVAMAVATVGIALPLRWNQMYRHREAVAPGIMLLCFYLIIHWGGSLLYNKYLGIGGAGNVTRSYASALWPIAFLIFFHLFGNSKQIPFALKICTFVALFRVLLGLFAMLTNFSFYIPVINYLPAPFIAGSGAGEGNIDFRFAGANLAVFATMTGLLAKRPSGRFTWFVIAFLGMGALLGGGGRGAIIIFSAFPLLLAVLYRKYFLLVSVGLFGLIVIALLNVFPTALNAMPYLVGRTLSIFVIEKSQLSVYSSITSSDSFHTAVIDEGYKRWTSDWNTLVFGTGIRPYDKGLAESLLWDPMSGENYMKNSANTGNYEAGLWTVLAVSGLTGLALYLLAFRAFFKTNWHSLRKNGIIDEGHAFAFVGAYYVVTWILFSWKTGGWPSEAIFYLYLGYIWIRDKNEEEARQPKKQQVPAYPMQSSGPRTLPGKRPDYRNPAYS